MSNVIANVQSGQARNFSTLQVDNSATLDSSGVLIFDTLANSGEVNILSTNRIQFGLVKEYPSQGSGTVEIHTGGTVHCTGTIVNQAFDFVTEGGTLTIDHPELVTNSSITRYTEVSTLTTPVGNVGSILHTLYNECLGRDPDEDGLAAWANAFGTTGISAASARGIFAGSSEAQNDIMNYYQRLLGRNASDGPSGDIAAWVNWLAIPGNCMAWIEGFIANSDESKSNLSTKFQAHFGTAPTTAQVTGWCGWLAPNSLAEIDARMTSNGPNGW